MESKIERDQPLQGMRVLVVDDEFLIVASIENALSEAGAEVLSAATLRDAIDCASNESFSAALLDVRLGRQTTEAVADVLATRAVPFAFHTGQSLPQHIRERHPSAQVLMKPSTQAGVVLLMLQLMPH